MKAYLTYLVKARPCPIWVGAAFELPFVIVLAGGDPRPQINTYKKGGTRKIIP
jgi:hypothetical protein